MVGKVFTRGMLAAALLLTPALASTGSIVSAAGSSIKVTLDGKAVPMNAQPRIVNDYTLVPYASIVSALGGKATWNASTKTVTVASKDVNVELTAGVKKAVVNHATQPLDAAPSIVNGTMFVPLRFLSETFGKWVSYSKPAATIALRSELAVTTSSGPVTLKKKPSRIATLSSSDTEIIYALGSSVVGRPTALGAVYPPQAASAPEIGSTHGILFEKLAAAKPDLVIASPALQSQKATIEALGAQVIFNAHNTYPEIQASVRLYGKILGKESRADQLIKGMDAKVSGLTKPAAAPKTLIVYGAPGSFVVALPSSYPGNFLALAGGKNVAASFPKMDEMPQYAELSLERIVAANPDLILLITHGDAAEVKASFKKQFESNPAWKSLGAVKNDRFEVLPSDLFAANPGLRAPEAISAINKILLQVK
ncbi:ABC transporter substrate-binding protein [Paenibacillus sp. MWE-103]|uniref:ABC transporter substrate-binding protein n=1 Tax=Paenibacillus artemisiicola TaxID=1172618 RepID=A0ABS3W885_9BACL|nr:ABC transporter substrate-binding protein [Paenibacillus artemisiicola]MBO7744509.1 ABC transporter substrate-binding protein [Paenibacillus artemisiicola]